MDLSNLITNSIQNITKLPKWKLCLSVLIGFSILKTLFKQKRVIKGKVAIVTGASSGIGMAIAKELAHAGCKVGLIARSRDKLQSIVDELNQQGLDAFFVDADLTKPDQVSQCYSRILEIIGDAPIDILVNNAGAGAWKFIEETSPEECQNMMALPYFAAFYMTRLVIPKMLKDNNGFIVNVNSPVCYQPWPGCIGYACSRFAFKGFTEGLRMDVRGTNVRVMEVIAGETDSNYFESNGIDDSHFPWASTLVPKISPSLVGKKTVQGIISNNYRTITPFTLSILIEFGETFPSFMRLLLGRTPRGDSRLKLLQQQNKNETNKKEL